MPQTTMKERSVYGQAVESVESQKRVSPSSHEPLIRKVPFPLDRANQTAAKTVRGQPCRLARPRPSGAPGGQTPDPFNAPHPLRYPLVPPFSSQQMISEGAGPSRSYFHKRVRSRCSLTRKKFWTGAPAPSPKTIPSMRKKGEEKNGSPSTVLCRIPKPKERSLSQHPPRLPFFRLVPLWNQCVVAGSSRVGINFRFQAHFWIGKCLPGEQVRHINYIGGLAISRQRRCPRIDGRASRRRWFLRSTYE